MPNLILFADDAVRIAAQSYSGPGFTDPNDDLSGYGQGKSFTRVDHRMRRNAFGNNWSSTNQRGAFLGGVPQIAFASARMQRGEVLPTLADRALGIASYPGLSAVMRPVARFFLPAAIGATASGFAAAALAVLPAVGLGLAAAKSVRYFGQFGRRLRHIEMGGDYEDTESALALRMRAVSDMSSAMSYSRRWLGNEALFMR